jgi:hypothetical protein
VTVTAVYYTSNPMISRAFAFKQAALGALSGVVDRMLAKGVNFRVPFSGPCAVGEHLAHWEFSIERHRADYWFAKIELALSEFPLSEADIVALEARFATAT